MLVASPIYSQIKWVKVKEELILKDPPFNECHAVSVVEVAPGKLLATWFGGSRESAKDVEIWASFLDNDHWSAPVSLANGIMDDSIRYPCWNPVLLLDKKGRLHLYYKVGPNPREWWGMERISMDKGKTWSSPIPLPKDILGPIKNKPIQLADGTILSPSSAETDEDWKVHIERSIDGGSSWKKIEVDPLTEFDVIQPSLLEYADGRIQMLCRSKQGKVIQAWSADKGQTWSKLTPTQLVNPNSGIDAVTLKNNVQLIVYNPDVPGKEWYNGRAKLRVATSSDGYKWDDVVILENGTTEEYSYPCVIEDSKGNVQILYTYDRKNIKYVVLQRRED